MSDKSREQLQREVEALAGIVERQGKQLKSYDRMLWLLQEAGHIAPSKVKEAQEIAGWFEDDDA